jgi:hypothetical protein
MAGFEKFQARITQGATSPAADGVHTWPSRFLADGDLPEASVYMCGSHSRPFQSRQLRSHLFVMETRPLKHSLIERALAQKLCCQRYSRVTLMELFDCCRITIDHTMCNHMGDNIDGGGGGGRPSIRRSIPPPGVQVQGRGEIAVSVYLRT